MNAFAPSVTYLALASIHAGYNDRPQRGRRLLPRACNTSIADDMKLSRFHRVEPALRAALAHLSSVQPTSIPTSACKPGKPSPMTAPPHLFLPPLPLENLLDPGCVFPAEELTRRVLSLFWHDYWCPPYCNRTPAPVFELDPSQTDVLPRALAAWWLTPDGIVTETESLAAPHLQPYWETTPRAARLWPRYDFRILASPFDVEMQFHCGAPITQRHRTRLFVQPDGRVRVLTRSQWWVG